MSFYQTRYQFEKSLQDVRDQFEEVLRTEWLQTRRDAIHLWKRASTTARKAARLSEEIAEEVMVESKSLLRSLQSHLVSEEFERQLEELIRKSDLEESFRTFSRSQAGDTPDTEWFSKVHASLYEDPFEAKETRDESGTASREPNARRKRIAQRLEFLFRAYRDEVLRSAKSGAVLGGTLGPKGAIRFAMAAGGLKLLVIVGGVTYTMLLDRTGLWQLA